MLKAIYEGLFLCRNKQAAARKMLLCVMIFACWERPWGTRYSSTAAPLFLKQWNDYDAHVSVCAVVLKRYHTPLRQKPSSYRLKLPHSIRKFCVLWMAAISIPPSMSYAHLPSTFTSSTQLNSIIARAAVIPMKPLLHLLLNAVLSLLW